MKNRKYFVLFDVYKKLEERAKIKIDLLSGLNPPDEKEKLEIKLLLVCWQKVRNEALRRKLQTRNLLVVKYSSFVKFIFNKYYFKKSGHNITVSGDNDFIQTGNIGLMMALERFDYKLGFEFTTYAHDWIMLYITKASVEYFHSDVDIPTQHYLLFQRYKKVKSELTQKNHGEPELSEIAENMGISEEDLKQLVQTYPTVASINQVIGKADEKEGLVLEDVISSRNICPVEIIENRQVRIVVRRVMKEKLNETEIKIVSLKDGLETGIGKDFSEVGKILGIKSEKARQVYNLALRKIKPDLKAFNN